MRQSNKEKLLTGPEQQLLLYEFAESMALGSEMTDVEVDASNSSSYEKLRRTPKKSYR